MYALSEHSTYTQHLYTLYGSDLVALESVSVPIFSLVWSGPIWCPKGLLAPLEHAALNSVPCSTHCCTNQKCIGASVPLGHGAEGSPNANGRACRMRTNCVGLGGMGFNLSTAPPNRSISGTSAPASFNQRSSVCVCAGATFSRLQSVPLQTH